MNCVSLDSVKGILLQYLLIKGCGRLQRYWLFYFLEESIYPLMCHSQLQGRIKFWKSPEQNI